MRELPKNVPLLQLIFDATQMLFQYHCIVFQHKADPRNILRVTEVKDMTGSPDYNKFQIEYSYHDEEDDDEHVRWIWDETSFRPTDPFAGSTLAEWYQGLKDFESQTGLNIMSTDWHVCDQSKCALLESIRLTEKILANTEDEVSV